MLKSFKNQLMLKKKADPKGFYAIFTFFFYALFTYELFNRPIGTVRNLEIALDAKIPFIKELIITYHTFMPMIILVGLLLFTYKKEEYKKYILALFLSQTIAYVVFVFYQTYVPRYPMELLGDDIFSRLVALTYKLNNNYAGAPSLHVCHMLLVSYYFSKIKMPIWVKVLGIGYFLLVASTTVLVKQHVFLDIPAGMVHAFLTVVFVEVIMRRRTPERKEVSL